MQFQKLLLDIKLNSENQDFYVFTKNGIPGKIMVGLTQFRNIHRTILLDIGIRVKYGLYSWKYTGAVETVKAGLSIKHRKK